MLSKNGGGDQINEVHAQQQDASSVELIKLDVSRTFPHLCFFQKDGPYHQPLHDVLGAYACYNTKIGYVSRTFIFLFQFWENFIKGKIRD